LASTIYDASGYTDMASAREASLGRESSAFLGAGHTARVLMRRMEGDCAAREVYDSHLSRHPDVGQVCFDAMVKQPVRYDRVAHSNLVCDCLETLKSVAANFSSDIPAVLWQHFVQVYDPILIYKQVRPAFAAARLCGVDFKELRDFVEGYALLKIVPAQMLDIQCDIYAASWNVINIEGFRGATEMWSFSDALARLGLELLAKRCPWSLEFLPALLTQMSICMFSNGSPGRRFDQQALDRPDKIVESYSTSDWARDLTSIYNESTFLAGLALAGRHYGEGLHRILLEQRRQRQRLDELNDMIEDLLVGELTLPWALGLIHPKSAKELRRLISKEIWPVCRVAFADRLERNAREKGLESTGARKTAEEAKALVIDAGVLDELYIDADNRWRRIIVECDAQFEGDLSSLFLIMGLKRAYLERMRQSGWKEGDIPCPPLDKVRMEATIGGVRSNEFAAEQRK